MPDKLTPKELNKEALRLDYWRNQFESFANHVFAYTMDMLNRLESIDTVGDLGIGEKSGKLPVMLTNLMIQAGDIATEIEKQKGATHA